uniref:TNFR-Cys domain-containing protein n=1 Tax=Arcella intermedia TaxID=1963864 RepID=A0A6B2KZG5_9EUKA
MVCDPSSGWQVIDIPCFDVPEKCIKGSCKNGQCVLEPQCHSYGCVQSSCVNGACVVSATTATCQTLPSDQQGCLKPKGCNVKTGDCIYEPCTFPQPCQIPTCLNGLCKSQNFNTGLDCQKCNLLCRNFPCVRQTCAPGGICVDTNICPDVTGMTTICNGSVYPPLCTYTPITNCSLLNQEGVDYVWDPVAIACVAVPVVCTPTIPGCSSARLVFDPVTKLNQCSEVLSCVGSGCTKETCVLDSTGTQGVCVQDPANCMGKDLCFDCPLGACTAEAIDCTSGDPCMVGSCSLQAGCYFAPLNCDDGDGCTQDSCVGGECLHRMCDDGDNCTLDSCDFERRECVFVQRTCDDNNQCTADSCVPDAGCVHVNVSNGCQSNDPCVKSYCDPFLGCVEKSVACSTPPNGAACSFAYCNSSSGTAQCVQVNASCLYALIDPNYQAAIVGGAVGGAALIGIVIAVVVVVTASGGGVAYYVKNAMDDTSEILTVNENPAHVMYGRGGENPLSADLLS